jgi:biopolymer transport protein ExbD
MAMSMPTGGDDEDGAINASINTTPLVDVMLVLLIIFLITIPVVTQTVPVKLPNETNVANKTNPQNIVIAIDAEGTTYWNNAKVDQPTLLAKLKERAVEVPQPEVHIRADINASYKYVGKVITDSQRMGIQKIAFITQPEHASAPQ